MCSGTEETGRHGERSVCFLNVMRTQDDISAQPPSFKTISCQSKVGGAYFWKPCLYIDFFHLSLLPAQHYFPRRPQVSQVLLTDVLPTGPYSQHPTYSLSPSLISPSLTGVSPSPHPTGVSPNTTGINPNPCPTGV